MFHPFSSCNLQKILNAHQPICRVRFHTIWSYTNNIKLYKVNQSLYIILANSGYLHFRWKKTVWLHRPPQRNQASWGQGALAKRWQEQSIYFDHSSFMCVCIYYLYIHMHFHGSFVSEHIYIYTVVNNLDSSGWLKRNTLYKSMHALLRFTVVMLPHCCTHLCANRRTPRLRAAFQHLPFKPQTLMVCSQVLKNIPWHML